MFENYSLREFTDELASGNPTPGGGSVAAFVGVLSAGLNSMVYSLTFGKKKFNEFEEECKKEIYDSANRTKGYINKFYEFMEEDKKVFELLMGAYKLPKGNEEEIKIREEKILENTKGALESPLNFARTAINLFNEIEIATRYGNRGAISDAGVAAILIHAAIESAGLNVKINLANIPEGEYKNSISREINYIQVESAYKKDKLIRTINNIMDGK
ncbi:cyclodeaminase/cyclohydrolase family protein [Clostridium sp. 'White wine YQ']|uniref:cyclodeaminase/cyclohydrolase family protein n=1 Tax=Clostridium sp. 'White wine YQ' TaxID=3027474 RepID=UPI00236613A9|nr:cyclodeaminase/cyclohydrolase family protein [Clostridium sp. 'White wine YQ']MDD7793983.1 cyclodeaminase/cyclohydrolase family protein [Clostridium sp. 'White wine YQ']